MAMFEYICKRVSLLVLVFLVCSVIAFVLIRLLIPDVEPTLGDQAMAELARREALGYDQPIMTQLFRYVRGIVTEWDFGVSWRINYMMPVGQVIQERLMPTIILNIYSMSFSLPLGILIGIWAAVKKNKLTDHIISTSVMIFISVPSFVVAFIMQYTLGLRLGWLPIIASSVHEAGGSWFTWIMTRSLIMPVLALSFGTIAGLTRSVRAELTESMTSDYMLLARAKGLTRARAISRHAMRNAMVPVLPGIVGMFLGILGGSLIIEQIFSVPGIGPLYLRALNMLDYDVFIAVTMFYLLIGLITTIVVDLSYGFIDPRIRMGER